MAIPGISISNETFAILNNSNRKERWYGKYEGITNQVYGHRTLEQLRARLEKICD